jgi:hypothetical protein
MRRDDPRERHAFMKLGELQLVGNDVIPLITSYPTDPDLVYNAREWSHGPCSTCGVDTAAGRSNSSREVQQQQRPWPQQGNQPCSSNRPQAAGAAAAAAAAAADADTVLCCFAQSCRCAVLCCAVLYAQLVVGLWNSPAAATTPALHQHLGCHPTDEPL